MKVKKENNRFNMETVIANYCFGTWDIGTLKGRSGEVCEVLWRRKVQVCCIQEIRWKDEGSRALQGYKLIWKGQVANRFHEAHGNFGYGTRNTEGERILEFAEAMGYVVTSTLFKKRVT